MNRSNILWTLMGLVFLILFNCVFFILGGSEHETSVWISYGFIHFSYAILILTFFLISKKINSSFLGYPLYAISIVYFGIELLMGVIFILIASKTYQTAFLLQFCLAGLYALCLIPNLIVNEQNVKEENRRKDEINFIKKADSELASIVESIHDRDTKKKVQKVYDTINSSPTKSNSSVSYLEEEILNAAIKLRSTINDLDNYAIQNQADALYVLINERNRQLKLTQ